MLPWREVGYFSPLTTALSSFQRVYEIHTETAPLFNPNDYSGGEWMTPQEIRRRVVSGEAAKSDLLLLLDLIYGAA